MCSEVICDTKKMAETDMIRMNHEMAMLLDTVKEYDDTPVQQACCDVLGKVRQVGDCVVYDECGALDGKTVSEEEITKRYGDRTGFEMWHNEIRLSRYERFNIGCVLPFLEAVKERMKALFPRQFCYIVYVTGTQDVDFRFHVYREEEGMWLDEDIEQVAEPLLYDLDPEQVAMPG